MSSWVLVVIAVAVVVAVAVVAWLAFQQSRRRQLQQTFGPEYDRELERSGDRRAVEAELQGRVKRRRSFQIVPLEPGLREHYTQAWTMVQARFVDDPGGAVREADGLVIDVMGRRGYPMSDFEERAGDISVDHPDVVENYRAAHAISSAAEQGDASTEDLRMAMVHYRALFGRLLVEDPAHAAQTAR